MTPFYLITGFLGSGKTTFIKNLLTQQADDLKIAVIQNEFAPNSIDGVELKHENNQVNIVEINNGSVFCSCLMGHFINTLKNIIQKYAPDMIYLEASGLADPGTISEILNDIELSRHIFFAGSVCLVDAVNFQKALSKMFRVVQQIRIADWLLLNKTDLVENTELQETERKLEKLNPYAKLIKTEFSKVDKYFSLNSILTPKGLILSPTDAGRPEKIKSVAIRTAKQIAKLGVEDFLRSISEITIRAKGFINIKEGGTILFQSVFGNYTHMEYDDYNANTEFTAIGENISVKQIKNLFESFVA